MVNLISAPLQQAVEPQPFNSGNSLECPTWKYDSSGLANKLKVSLPMISKSGICPVANDLTVNAEMIEAARTNFFISLLIKMQNVP